MGINSAFKGLKLNLIDYIYLRFTMCWCKQQSCAAAKNLTSHHRREQEYFSWNIWIDYASKGYQRPYRSEGKKKGFRYQPCIQKFQKNLLTASTNNRRLSKTFLILTARITKNVKRWKSRKKIIKYDLELERDSVIQIFIYLYLFTYFYLFIFIIYLFISWLKNIAP